MSASPKALTPQERGPNGWEREPAVRPSRIPNTVAAVPRLFAADPDRAGRPRPRGPGDAPCIRARGADGWA